MQPLKNVQSSSDGVLYVFYDIETTQNTQYSETAQEHVPNLLCLQQFCSSCEGVDDSGRECERCGIRQHAFWEDPVGDLLTYLFEQRPWVRQIIAIALNAKAFDLHFILRRGVLLKWRPELVMSGQKIILMKISTVQAFCPSRSASCPAHSVRPHRKGGIITILIRRKTWTMWVPYTNLRIKASMK